MRHYLGATIGIIGIIILAIGNITAVGEFIYNIVKTDLGFLELVWESVKTWLSLNIIGISLYFGGVIIQDK